MKLFVLYLTDGKQTEITAERYHRVGDALEFQSAGRVVASIAASRVICVDSEGLTTGKSESPSQLRLNLAAEEKPEG